MQEKTKFEVTVGDLIEAAGVQVPLYRPVFFKFPEKVNGRELGSTIMMSGPQARQWEFNVYQLPANNLTRKIINQIPILLTTVSVNPIKWDDQKGQWFDLNRFGFKALNPGLHICPECGFMKRFTTYEQSRYTVKGQIPCRAGLGCKGIMLFRKVHQTEGVPEDVVEGLRHMYAEGARPELTAHPPEIYMIIAYPSKAEWTPINQRMVDIRMTHNTNQPYCDIVPWKLGLQSGEKPIGATMILPEESHRLGWAAEEVLFGHRDQRYMEQFIYVRKEYSVTK